MFAAGLQNDLSQFAKGRMWNRTGQVTLIPLTIRRLDRMLKVSIRGA